MLSKKKLAEEAKDRRDVPAEISTDDKTG
jgi:hypothetical protein